MLGGYTIPPPYGTIGDSLGLLLDSQKLADCVFLVGAEKTKISAHKLILASRSEMFHAMFYGSLPHDRPVEIPIFQPDVFSAVIRYIYTDKIYFKDVECAMEVFLVANYALLNSLKEMCWDFIERRMTINDCLKVYEFSKFHGNISVESASKKLICNNASTVLSSDKFLDCKVSTLEMIVQQDYLNISSETVLIAAVEKWAKFNAKKESKPLPNFLPRVQTVLSELRFLSLTAEDFAEEYARSPMLTVEEQRDILIILNRKRKNQPAFRLKRLSNNRHNRWEGSVNRQVSKPSFSPLSTMDDTEHDTEDEEDIWE